LFFDPTYISHLIFLFIFFADFFIIDKMVATFKDMLGCCPQKNLVCPKLACGQVASLLSQVKSHPTLQWCRVITCNQCYGQWFICVNCPSGRVGRLTKHILKVHKKSAGHLTNHILKVREKSAGHRRNCTPIPDEPAIKHDEEIQMTFEGECDERFNEPMI
jgi:hypothetical protein